MKSCQAGRTAGIRDRAWKKTLWTAINGRQGWGGRGSSRSTPGGSRPMVGRAGCSRWKARWRQKPRSSGAATTPGGVGQGSPVCGWRGTTAMSGRRSGRGTPGPARTACLAGRPCGRAARKRRKASARGRSTVTGEPSAAATRWASVTEASASQRGSHSPVRSSSGVPHRSSASSAQSATGRAGPARTGRTAAGSSQVACHSEQSSIRVATLRPQPAQVTLGPLRPSMPQQAPYSRRWTRAVPWASPGAITIERAVRTGSSSTA